MAIAGALGEAALGDADDDGTPKVPNVALIGPWRVFVMSRKNAFRVPNRIDPELKF